MAAKKDILSEEVLAIDLEKIRTIEDLVKSFGRSSIQSRSIGLCASVYEKALLDPLRPTIMLGLAGPLIAGGLRKIIRDMIHYGLVDVIVSIGAIPYQDFYQARGHKHYMGSPKMDDIKLRELFIDRIYDTLVDEEKFRETDQYIGRIADRLEPRTYSSREFMEILGKQIKDANSILWEAARCGVPIFVPALNDSSIGIGLTGHYVRCKKEGRQPILIDQIRDNWEIAQIKIKSPRTAAFYVAGGVPKNYIQQTEVIAETLGYEPGGHYYVMQITVDAPHWGGLSGCTFEEAQSWGKVHKDARKAQAYVEATIGLPLIVGYLLQKGVWKKRKRRKFTWKGEELKKIE